MGVPGENVDVPEMEGRYRSRSRSRVLLFGEIGGGWKSKCEGWVVRRGAERVRGLKLGCVCAFWASVWNLWFLSWKLWV